MQHRLSLRAFQCPGDDQPATPAPSRIRPEVVERSRRAAVVRALEHMLDLYGETQITQDLHAAIRRRHCR